MVTLISDIATATSRAGLCNLMRFSEGVQNAARPADMSAPNVVIDKFPPISAP